MTNKQDILQLIEECSRNSRRAQESLFKLFYGKMLYLCLRYHKDRDTAQEVVQEGFIKVFEKLSAFDRTGSFEAWMRRIMVNTAIDLIRKQNKNTFVELNENLNDKTDDDVNLSELEFQENTEIALECIQELTPAYRTVFNLFYVEEYSHKEIAEKLGISEGTSKSNLAKAKLRMKTLMEQKILQIRK